MLSIYAERGLSRTRVSIWLYEGRLHVAHREALLARYAYRYDLAAPRKARNQLIMVRRRTSCMMRPRGVS